MKKFMPGITIVLAIIFGTGFFSTTGHSAGSAPVTVMNDPSHPVPVTSTIVNDPSDPIPVAIVTNNDNPVSVTSPYVRQPIQHFGVITIDEDSATFGQEIFEVPTDKLFVLEYVSFQGRLPSGQTLGPVMIADERDRNRSIITLPPSTIFPGGTIDLIYGSALVRVYFLPGQLLEIRFMRNPYGGGGHMIYSISGYLIPNDSPTLAP